ncbi:hypothetical protein [Bacillus paranthracis]|uniref:hypothetical protein n=1 Tax=Bacillus paranthracis TaxID=2026186 RepID=UPI0013D2CA68|nr:hypothetical protein [Bacillus paranthracis]MDK7446672.1 hypothetical protein [Bacillus paranthracis]MDN8630732.1 hypothetical protein [Bacillus paranthracis]MDN8637830.1 hypothetical protein [Bacillus paranthracis]HDR7855462.1 hypothetical protein [Bacillus paranthracis]
MDAEREVKALLDSLSRDELIDLLKKSGFEVREGKGRVIYTEQEQEQINDKKVSKSYKKA